MLHAFDVFAVLFSAITIMCVCALPAYAYVDPSVMTYTIQAVAGVAVALGAVAGVAFRRSRNVIMRVLHIDADAKKIKEENIARIEPSDEEAYEQANQRAQALFEGHKTTASNTDKSHNGKTHTSMSWPIRIIGACVVCAFAFFTLFVCAPAELVQGNSADLAFSLTQILPTLLLFALICTLVLALAISAIRGNAFEITLLVIFGIALCFYIQPLLLNAGLPSANGATVAWQEKTDTMLINLGIWLAIIVAILVIRHFQPRITRLAAIALSVVLIIVQCAGVVSLYSESVSNPKLTGTNAGLFEVSSKQNCITFVLDTFDSAVAQELEATYPYLYAEVTSEMDGFTFFPDTTAAHIPTAYAIPYLITGQSPNTNETWADYRANMFQRSSYLPNISQATYSIGIYTDSLVVDPQNAAFFAQNTVSHQANVTPINTFTTVAQLCDCALYRDAPWLLKPFFWFTTDQINAASTKDISDASYRDAAYVMDDIGLYQHLTTDKLQIQTEDASFAGAYRLIHIQGSHYPYIMDENCKSASSDILHQTLGALRIVNEYLRQMKELGVYDSSTIIITADHGNWYLTEEPLDETSCPATYIKTAHSANTQGITESTIELSHGDVLATVAHEIGFDGSVYGTYAFELNPTAVRTRTFYWALNDGTGTTGIQKYLITGNAQYLFNWTPTDEIWPVE